MDRLIAFARKSRTRLAERLSGHPVVFIHVPKCGGTSLGRAIRTRYLLSQQTIGPEESYRAVASLRPDLAPGSPDLFAAVHMFRQEILLYLLHGGTRCVSAHVPFTLAAHRQFSGRYKFVTLLRDPVKRYISHYFYSYGRDAHAGIHEPLESFIESPRGKAYGALYSEFYSGLPAGSDFTAATAIDQAKANLDACFSVIGFLDDLPGMTQKLADELGISIKIGHANKATTPKAERRQAITPEIEARIRDICAPDIDIYTHARNHIRKQATS